jgi:hypothetical protein
MSPQTLNKAVFQFLLSTGKKKAAKEFRKHLKQSEDELSEKADDLIKIFEEFKRSKNMKKGSAKKASSSSAVN